MSTSRYLVMVKQPEFWKKYFEPFRLDLVVEGNQIKSIKYRNTEVSVQKTTSKSDDSAERKDKCLVVDNVFKDEPPFLGTNGLTFKKTANLNSPELTDNSGQPFALANIYYVDGEYRMRVARQVSEDSWIFVGQFPIYVKVSKKIKPCNPCSTTTTISRFCKNMPLPGFLRHDEIRRDSAEIQFCGAADSTRHRFMSKYVEDMQELFDLE